MEMDPFDEDDEVFLENEVSAELEEDLWSSPLMNYSSPFDDYKDLFSNIPETPSPHKSSGYRSSSSSTKSSRLPVSLEGMYRVRFKREGRIIIYILSGFPVLFEGTNIIKTSFPSVYNNTYPNSYSLAEPMSCRSMIDLHCLYLCVWTSDYNYLWGWMERKANTLG